MTDRTLGYGRAQLDRTSLADDQPLTFTASSTQLNRHGFSLRNEGWRLDNFNANPVLLWMHNPFRPPIGQGRALSKDQKIVLDAVTFDREDELARSIESKFRRGFLNAVSVSWDWQLEDGTPVTDPWRMSDEQVRDELFYDLAEVSAVSVPGDPRAVSQQSRLALARLSDELVELADEREHGAITAPELQAAVRAELTRLGIDPALLAAGTPPGDPPVDERDTEDAASGGFTPQEVQSLQAAFTIEGVAP